MNDKALETRCTRSVLENLAKVGRKIGQRTRMKQLIAEHGIVDTVRSLADKETSGWNDLYLAGLIGLSAEATIVEFTDFRSLFTEREITAMEAELRAVDYEPKPPQ